VYGCTITISICDLLTDLKTRLLTGENSDEVSADLEYGLLAEVSEFISKLFNQVQSEVRDMVYRSDSTVDTNSSESQLLSPWIGKRVIET
jgi:hypothetical protein